MMPAAACMPPGIDEQALLAELRRLSWGAADILLAYGRGEQPPYGFPPALSVDEGGEGPVSAADLAVNQWLPDGLVKAFPRASSIAQYSPLLPPVGVWAVSQSQCGRSPSQAGYPSLPW